MSYDGVDEDYGRDEGDEDVPVNIPVIPYIRTRPRSRSSSPQRPPQSRVARFRTSSSDSDSDSDSYSEFNLDRFLSRMNHASSADANDIAAALAQGGLRHVVEQANPNTDMPIRDNVLNAALRPHATRRSRAFSSPEEQWRRLTTREKDIIRRFLQQIPCAVTHASELGMMRLINRFRNALKLNGGSKRNAKYNNKTSQKSKKTTNRR